MSRPITPPSDYLTARWLDEPRAPVPPSARAEREFARRFHHRVYDVPDTGYGAGWCPFLHAERVRVLASLPSRLWPPRADGRFADAKPVEE